MRLRGRGLAGVAAWACLSIAIGCAPGGGGTAEAPADGKPAAAPASGKRAAASASARRTPARPPDLAAIEREVVTRVNRYRRSEGLAPLSNDTRIAEIARGHSRAMAAGRSSFGHDGFRDRSKAVEGKVPYRRVAENVARHRRRASAEIPGVAVDGWVGSWGHRHNIEGPFTLTGVGAAVGADGSVYLTQVFVAPR